ncbi:MAG: ABC transporter substrate-binding protein [Holophagales bacterium]|nr:ABC transporter substrate-binding protein [Holophagales bacterium]
MASCGPASEPTPRALDEPLRIALHGEPTSLDPHLQSEAIAHAVLGNIYETLVAFDAAMTVVPALAESWETPDDRLWRFRLRPNARFHDGSELDARDVLASLERARRHPESRQQGALLAITEARSLDAHTVELVTAEPYPILLARLALVHIVPEGSPEEIREPVGSGPYRFEGLGAGVLRLRATVETWNGQPVWPRAEYAFVSDPTARTEGLLDGWFDFVDDLEAADLSRVRAHPALRVESMSSLAVAYLQMDPGRSPFDDIRFRQAIHLGIDRRALAEELQGGYARPAGQLVSRNVFGYSPGLEAVEQSLERARALLAESGYQPGTPLELEVRAGRDPGPLRRQLEELGVVVEIRERPWKEMYQRLVERRAAFYLGGWVSTSGDAGDVLDRKLHTHDPEAGYGDANFTSYSNPELDRLVKESNSVIDLELRQEMLQRAMALGMADLVYLPLYSESDLYGLRADARFQPRQDGRVYAHEMHP